MFRMKLKGFNYYPDFKNESLVNQGKKIINGIKHKSLDGYENFGFHELALNFGDSNLKELHDFAKILVNNNIRDLIILTNTININNFKTGFQFLFKYDLLQKNKIKFHFINEDLETLNWFTTYNNLKHLISKKTTGVFICKFSKFNDLFFNFAKVIVNNFQQNIGYYRALEKIFLIGKETLEQQFEFLEISSKNRLVIPNILNNNYSFFSEINLLLLLLQGADLDELLEGYSSASDNFTGLDLEKNLAFQYGYIRYIQKKYRNTNLLIGNNKILKNCLALLSSFNNNLFIKNDIFTSEIIFNNEIYTYGQYLLDNNKNIYVTYFEIDAEKNDFRISDEINFDDGLIKLKESAISYYAKSVNDGVVATLTNIANIPLTRITIENNSEFSLGYLINFLYWSLIYECYLDKINPFVI
ncbi:glucose-6-phosphate isomerase [Mycoplasmopsis lipofaciens]|uniref:hypothetical protein n=1 Tax=Mycoplasmopsis lipofaciens TaxID=114884 RepID=UPI000489DACF|nr:hypothetical protein [Mycoplasmopsis lipofaciens]